MASPILDIPFLKALPGEHPEKLLRRFAVRVKVSRVLSEHRAHWHFVPKSERLRLKRERHLARERRRDG